MAKINKKSLGKDSIKGGIFFDSDLAPKGTFSNIPAYIEHKGENSPKKKNISVTYTLKRIKDSISEKLKEGTENESEKVVNTFLKKYTELLIDNEDIRNSVFFGSSYNEMLYNIITIINTYPYKSFLCKDESSTPVQLDYNGTETTITYNKNNFIFPQRFSLEEDTSEKFTDEYVFIDSLENKFKILQFNHWFEAKLTANAIPNGTNFDITFDSPTTEINVGDKIEIYDSFDTKLGSGEVVIITNQTNITISYSGNIGDLVTNNYIFFDDIKQFVIDGIMSISNTFEYKSSQTELYKGFLLSKNDSKLLEFETGLSSIQKSLLSFTNPTPWVREDITANIIVEGNDFDLWIENPANMVKRSANEDPSDAESITSNNLLDYNIVSALTLDESETNRLLVKAIPHRLVNELNDADGRYFTRFILLAGKFFDVSKIYIDFLKYTHTLNYSEFNQLSPEFYSLYADHYGFSLITDNVDLDNILVLTTLTNSDVTNLSSTGSYSSYAARKSINELNKRLLINLFYVYKKKGTISGLETLINLLGTPLGLIIISEYNYNSITNELFVKNDKVYSPKTKYVIDKDYLLDPNNLNNPINKPYKYKSIKLDDTDEQIYNMRELSVEIDPLNAILNNILKFGKIGYEKYVGDGSGSYLSLQNEERNYLLPLNIPNRFNGLSINYEIPLDSYLNEDNNKGCQENKFTLAGLFSTGNVYYGKIKIDSIAITGSNGGMLELEIAFNRTDISNIFNQYILIEDSDIIKDGEYLIDDIDIISGQTLMAIYIDEYKYNYSGTVNGYAGGENYVDGVTESILKNFKNEYRLPVNNNNERKLIYGVGTSSEEKYMSRKNKFLVENFVPHSSISGITESDISYATGGLELVLEDNGSPSVSTTLGTGNSIQELIDNVNKETSDIKFVSSFNVENNGTENVYNIFGYVDIYNDNTNFIEYLDYVLKIKFINAISGTKSKFSNIENNSLEQNESDEYIVAQIEGKDLVIRMKVISELDSPPYFSVGDEVKRVAILEDVFYPDGLLHNINILMRPRGAEVYMDDYYIGTALWNDVLYIPSEPVYTPLTYPKRFIINGGGFQDGVFGIYDIQKKTPDNIGENDLLTWFDLFVGMPVNMKVNINNISVYTNNGVNDFDSFLIKDVNFGNSEVFEFDFKNQEKDNTTLLYNTDNINVSLRFHNMLPKIPQLSDTFNNFFNDFIADNEDLITLKDNKLLYSNTKKNVFENSKQTLFLINGIEELEDLFLNSSYLKTIEKDRIYYRYSRMLFDSYLKFSDEIITLIGLINYIDLMDEKIIGMLKMFIPILISLKNFGRSFKSLNEKIYYNRIYKKCDSTILENDAMASFEITHVTDTKHLHINTMTKKDDVISVIESTPDLTVKFSTKHEFIMGEEVTVGLSGITVTPPPPPTTPTPPTITDIVDEYTIKIHTDGYIGSWDSNGYSYIRKDNQELFDSTVESTIEDTVNKVVNNINISLSPNFYASNENNVVKIYANAEYYDNLYNKDINNEKLYFSYNINYITIDNTNNFSGGHQFIDNGTECFEIEYISVNPPIPTSTFFIYTSDVVYDGGYIGYDSETGIGENYITYSIE